MPIFIALGKVSGQGMQNLDHLTARHEEAVRRAKLLGGRVISSYATMGSYDFVVTLDCPTLEVAMTILNREASGGNIRYETLVGMPTRDFARMFLDEATLMEERTVLRRKRSAPDSSAKNRSAKKKPAAKKRTGGTKTK